MPEFDELFAELRELLTRHESSLALARDDPGDVQMESTKTTASGTRMWFAAVQTREQYVSFHLMAVYSHPDLLADISELLRAQLVGKGCFNLTPQSATPELLAELSALVDTGLDRYRADGLA